MGESRDATSTLTDPSSLNPLQVAWRPAARRPQQAPALALPVLTDSSVFTQHFGGGRGGSVPGITIELATAERRGRANARASKAGLKGLPGLPQPAPGPGEPGQPGARPAGISSVDASLTLGRSCLGPSRAGWRGTRLLLGPGTARPCKAGKPDDRWSAGRRQNHTCIAIRMYRNKMKWN